MANDDLISARGGLLPIQWPFGAIKSKYYKLTTGAAAANVFIGTPVDLDANGQAAFAATGTANAILLGSVIGFADTNLASIPSAMANLANGAYLPGNTDAYVLVADDPQQEFLLQEDTGGSALTASNVGNNVGWKYRSSSGNTTTGYATAELQRATASTATGGSLILTGLYRNINSDGTDNAAGNYAKWIVRITQHRFGPATGAQAI